MQVFGNVATTPERLTSKASGRVYWQTRVAESHRGLASEPPTWYTVRIMKEADPQLAKGDFVKVTGRLKTDFWTSRDGKPTGGLVVIAFEAAKIAKPAAAMAPSAVAGDAPAPTAKTTEVPEPQVGAPAADSLKHATQAMLVDWTD